MRTTFDRTKAIKAAWDALWAERLAERERQKGTVWETGRWAAATRYITASDLERRVRIYAEETLAGKPWGSTGAYGPGLGRIRISGNLFNDCRDWLLRERSCGRLEAHNFGKGHISGMRFRPAGEPMAEAEIKTMVVKEKRRNRPVVKHYSEHGYGSRPLCMHNRMKGRYMFRPSKAWVTRDRAEVTCVRCKNLMGGAVTGRIESDGSHIEEH